MKGIRKRLFKNIFMVFVVTFLIVEIAFVFFISSYFYNSIESMMKERLNLTISFYERFIVGDHFSIEEITRKAIEEFDFADKAELQFIDKFGNLLGSSHDRMLMNFEPSPDIDIAMKGVVSKSVFQSELGEKLLSVSGRISGKGDDFLGVLRLVTSISRVDELLYQIIILSIVLFILITFLAIVNTAIFSRTIINPIKEISESSILIAKGNFDNKIIKYYDDEIGELAENLNFVSEELKKSEDLKNEFVSSVSHELKTPLTAIFGWAETIKTGDFGREEVEKGLDVIIKESKRLSALVEELLDFSRIENDSFRLNIEKMDIHEVIEESKNLLVGQLGDKYRIEICFKEKVFIKGDKSRIKQVMINVLDNACKFSSQDSIVKVFKEEIDDYIVISIEDKGRGINAKDLPYVTKKFYKGQSKESGSGLGLTISEKIMKSHDGELKIQSSVNLGTLVSLWFPRLHG